jgi:hypothetical protein
VRTGSLAAAYQEVRPPIGASDEERTRFCEYEGPPESTCQRAQETGHAAAGRRRDRYFKALAEETGIPYQNLINLYLRHCAHAKKKPALSWTS